MVCRLTEFYASFHRLRLPLVCRLITSVMDHLDDLLEEEDLASLNDDDGERQLTVSDAIGHDANVAVNDGFEADNGAPNWLNRSNGATFEGAQKPQEAMTKPQSGAPPQAIDAATMLWEIACFPIHYLFMIRPGLMMCVTLFAQSKVEYIKLALYVLWFMLLDWKFLPPGMCRYIRGVLIR